MTELRDRIATAAACLAIALATLIPPAIGIGLWLNSIEPGLWIPPVLGACLTALVTIGVKLWREPRDPPGG